MSVLFEMFDVVLTVVDKDVFIEELSWRVELVLQRIEFDAHQLLEGWIFSEISTFDAKSVGLFELHQFQQIIVLSYDQMNSVLTLDSLSDVITCQHFTEFGNGKGNYVS